MREQMLFIQNTLFVEVLTILQIFLKIRKDKEKHRSSGDSDRQLTERSPDKFFICRSVDHLIAKFPKPPKYNKKRRKQVLFNERGNFALKK